MMRTSMCRQKSKILARTMAALVFRHIVVKQMKIKKVYLV